MDALWSSWWMWLAGALVLAIVEVLLPAQIFLGFAIGAAIVGLVLLFGLTGSLPVVLLVFAVASLIGWIVLRRTMGVYQGQVKVWERDINDD